jgi:hypothetical protein
MESLEPFQKEALRFLRRQVTHGNRGGLDLATAHPSVGPFRHDLLLLGCEDSQISLVDLRGSWSGHAETIKDSALHACSIFLYSGNICFKGRVISPMNASAASCSSASNSNPLAITKMLCSATE